GLDLPAAGRVMEIGRGRIVREMTRQSGPERGGIAILSLGPRLAEALKAADMLAAQGLAPTVADARFAKPLDTALIEQLARN
ncbi:1-deoxy-D-xylulose-5-phosphate synthase, partial [Gluconacetobacter entanii]